MYVDLVKTLTSRVRFCPRGENCHGKQNCEDDRINGEELLTGQNHRVCPFVTDVIVFSSATNEPPRTYAARNRLVASSGQRHGDLACVVCVVEEGVGEESGAGDRAEKRSVDGFQPVFVGAVVYEALQGGEYSCDQIPAGFHD